MQFRKLLSLLLTSVTAGIAAAIVLLFLMPEVMDQLRPQPELHKLEPQAVLPRHSGPFSYADAVTTASPSVVNIYTTKI
ncbi:MAG: transcriptional regulator, partial [Chromatiales bacterium]